MTEILTISDVASLLKMTKRQVYELCRERTRQTQANPIPLFRVNGNTRMLRSSIEAWVQKLEEEAK
jgi:predicted DNA-binding transcriptional regulator AlpA